MTFVQRKLTAIIDMQDGSTVTLSGLRMSATVKVVGGPTQNTMDLVVYGMSLSLMNKLSCVGTQFLNAMKVGITLQAGDDLAGMSTVFAGDIWAAFVDAQSMPNVCFRIHAQPGTHARTQPAAPTSVKGSADAATLFGGLAKQVGLTLENNGVNVKIMNPYLSGSAMTQIATLARHVGISHTIDNKKLVIAPAGATRTGTNTLISPETGMVGYPSFMQAAVMVKVLFNPTLKVLGKATIKSALTPACGQWMIFSIVHELECLTPKGKWFTCLTLHTTNASTATQQGALVNQMNQINSDQSQQPSQAPDG